MAYTKNQIEKLSLAAIEKHELVFIEDVVSFLPVSRATFYNWHLDKLDTIKEAIIKTKVDIKSKLRKRWAVEDAPATQIALYKILGNEEETDALNGRVKEDAQSITINLPKGAELELEKE